ncbi:MAG: galactosyltransferase-related protein [Ignavibacteria bacterium]|jgi:hypothetical protein
MSVFTDASYIIQHRDHTVIKDRTRNLLEVLKHIRSVSSDVEILVLEQDAKESEIKDLISPYNVTYKLLFNPGLFNRSWGFNCSAKITEKNKLIFADNDMLIDKGCFSRGLESLDTFSIVRPFNGVSNDMTEGQTNHYVNTKITSLGNIRPITSFSGGIIMFNKSDFFKIGMFDERFEGWGGEDDEMMSNIQNHQSRGLITVTSLNSPVTHLYHSRNVYDSNTQPNYSKNLSFMTDGRRNEGIEVLGSESKYV